MSVLVGTKNESKNDCYSDHTCGDRCIRQLAAAGAFVGGEGKAVNKT